MIIAVTNKQTLFKDIETTSDLEYALDKLPIGPLGVDIETTGLNFLTDTIKLLQLGNENIQIVVDMDYISKERLLASKIPEILNSTSILKLFFNANFDLKFLYQIGISVQNLYDIMIAEMVISAGTSEYRYPSLKATVKKYLSVDLDKETRKEFLEGKDISQTQIIYAAKDIEHLEKIARLQTLSIEEENLGNVLKLENRIVPILARAEFNGMLLDVESWKTLAKVNEGLYFDQLLLLDKIVEESSELKSGLVKHKQLDLFIPENEIRNVGINWKSPIQVLKLLKNIAPELESVDANVIEDYSEKHKIFKEYIRANELKKLSTSYGLKFLEHVWKDGKIHTSYTQIVDTGRMASSKPNMQQIPQEGGFRECFIPEAGNVFVSCDFSSQELALIATDSEDPVWLQALKDNQDLHSVCAELVFGKTWERAADPECEFYANNKQKCNCKAHKDLRTKVKTINFGLAYGMSAMKASSRLKISVEEAEELIYKYFSVFPKIKESLERSAHLGITYGKIKTMLPFERIRKFSEWEGPRTNKAVMSSIERKSKNTRIQGSGADMIKLALVYIDNYIKANELSIQIIGVIHDEILTTCKEYDAQWWSGAIESLMEDAGKVIIKSGLLKASANISKKWTK